MTKLRRPCCCTFFLLKSNSTENLKNGHNIVFEYGHGTSPTIQSVYSEKSGLFIYITMRYLLFGGIN